MGTRTLPTPTAGRSRPRGGPAGPVLDLVVPVHNEAHVLEASIRSLHAHLTATMPFDWRITVADNASTDGTAPVAHRLAAELAGVRVLELPAKGRGRALRAAWESSDAAVLAYTDVDLSTGLDALLPLVAPLVTGHSDVAIGSRLARGASVARGPRRELVSRAYNLLLRAVFAVRFTDAQCGFKAVRAEVARTLVPLVEDDSWFFDTELLLLADHNDLRIHEVAVDWVDDPDSRVQVVRTALDDLAGVARMVGRFATGGGDIDRAALRSPGPDDDMGRQLVVFAAVGALCTAISLALFLGLRPLLGPLPANAAATSGTALVNAWLNHRATFGRRGRAPWRRDLHRSLTLHVALLGTSSVALVAVGAAGLGVVAEVVALVGVWLGVAVARFRWLRS